MAKTVDYQFLLTPIKKCTIYKLDIRIYNSRFLIEEKIWIIDYIHVKYNDGSSIY